MLNDFVSFHSFSSISILPSAFSKFFFLEFTDFGKSGSQRAQDVRLLVFGELGRLLGQLDREVRGLLLELGAGFHPDFNGRENIYMQGALYGLDEDAVEERIDEIIAFAELADFIDMPVKTYSSGMFMRLAFSIAAHVDADIMLLDEVLAVGDASGLRIVPQVRGVFLRGSDDGLRVGVSVAVGVAGDVAISAGFDIDGSAALEDRLQPGSTDH